MFASKPVGGHVAVPTPGGGTTPVKLMNPPSTLIGLAETGLTADKANPAPTIVLTHQLRDSRVMLPPLVERKFVGERRDRPALRGDGRLRPEANDVPLECEAPVG